MPETILQRWTHLFGPDAGGNNSPDSLAAKANGTDGNGVSGTAAISHTNPMRDSSALDEGFNSSNPLPPGHHDSDVGLLWNALVANGGSSGSMTSTVSGVGKSIESKTDAIRKSGITVSKTKAGGYRGRTVPSYVHTRGNHRLNEVNTDYDSASISAAAGH